MKIFTRNGLQLIPIVHDFLTFPIFHLHWLLPGWHVGLKIIFCLQIIFHLSKCALLEMPRHILDRRHHRATMRWILTMNWSEVTDCLMFQSFCLKHYDAAALGSIFAGKCNQIDNLVQGTIWSFNPCLMTQGAIWKFFWHNLHKRRDHDDTGWPEPRPDTCTGDTWEDEERHRSKFYHLDQLSWHR